MAKYTKSLLDLIKEEDELLTEREEVRDDIVENLYIVEECHKDKKRVEEAEKKIELLRRRESEIDSELDAMKRVLKRYLLDLCY